MRTTGPECRGGWGGLLLDPGVEVLAAVARVGGHQADLGPFIDPPDDEASDGPEGRPLAWVAGHVDEVNKAPHREA